MDTSNGTIVALTRTCRACPEQWEGETADGRAIYLRHRHGCGYVNIGPGIIAAITAGWGPPFEPGGRTLLAWVDEDWDGMLCPGALPHILYLAGLSLTPELEARLHTSPGVDDVIADVLAAAAELGIHLTGGSMSTDAPPGNSNVVGSQR